MTPFEKNVPGPFYTTGGCLACGAPEFLAPDLLAALDEVERACQAAEFCCVGALRYGGADPAIIRRLGNSPLYCDHILPRKFWWQYWARLR